MKRQEDAPVLIVYFSGTGGTRLAAQSLAQSLNDRGKPVILHPLDKSVSSQNQINIHEKPISALVLLYAVHAMDAPLPVHSWIKGLPELDHLPAVVISVSGGGEVWPNTACRRRVIRSLSKKRAIVFLEEMYIMPANWITSTPVRAASELLRVLPYKTGRTAQSIIQLKSQRTPFHFLGWLFAWISHLEQFGAPHFGKSLYANEDCDACGWCASNCPQLNIVMRQDKPDFTNQCVMCMRCLYGCHRRAIQSRILKFMVLKEGFNLSRITVPDQRLTDLKAAVPGILWKGVRDYLADAYQDFDNGK